jgi:Flp pilus assembly protein TadD
MQPVIYGGHSGVTVYSRFLFFSCVITLVSACSSFSRPPEPASTEMVSTSMRLLNDELFEADKPEPAPPQAAFLQLPVEIRRQLDQTVLPMRSEEERYNTLRSWAFKEFQGDYEYDPSFTSPLAELSDNKRINCFSFSNMFVASARYAGIPAQFQLVNSPPQWDVNNDTWVVSQHINVTGTVQRTLSESERRRMGEEQRAIGTRIQRVPPANVSLKYVVDLNPAIAVDSYRSEVISDDEALSLLYSNRSVEALLTGATDSAYRLGKLAILTDEKSSTAWNNLGVLMSRAGKLEQAREAYRTALALDPRSESPANNLESIYRRLGADDKADAMAQRILANRKKNPYFHYSLGESTLASGDLKDAAGHFKDAIKLKDDERLFYYGLAETQIRLAEYKKASRSLKTAKKLSTRQDMSRYNLLNTQLTTAAKKG